MTIRQRLYELLSDVGRRYRMLLGGFSFATIWLALAAIGAAFLHVEASWILVLAVIAVGGTALVISSVVWWLVARTTRNEKWIAQRIEARHPELSNVLVTAIEQQPNLPDDRYGFLQEQVLLNALDSEEKWQWHNDIPRRRVLAAQITSLASLGLLVFVITGLVTRAAQGRRDHRMVPAAGTATREGVVAPEVTPGDTELERGTSLVVTAQFPGEVPDQATLVTSETNGSSQQVAMSLSLSDPVFGSRIPEVDADFHYWIEYSDRRTESYNVVVYEYPRLVRADAELSFPAYTSMPEKRVEDTRRITVVEGTKITVFCRLNKPVSTAAFVNDQGEEVALTVDEEDPRMYFVTRVAKDSEEWRLLLSDEQGRSNKDPARITFNVTRNQRPDMNITSPGRDVRVSPLEELETKATVWDDFGLEAYGISYSLANNSPQEVRLGEATAGNERRNLEYLLSFESLGAEPNQLLAYHFWAEDTGPDGEVRRTLSDMYFAEVRHFEEIYRQGEQPPANESSQQQQQNGGQNGQEAEQLVELQKQIINATWKVSRRETGESPSAAFFSDVTEIETAQSAAIEKLDELVEKLDDGESLQHADDVRQHMVTARDLLGSARETNSSDSLSSALDSERAAYQSLLQLRSREHEVVRSQSSQSQSQSQSGSATGPQSRAQQQLEQLELDSAENRYETERQASQQRDRGQQDTVEVLNRLRELSRRQNDLNERLKDLQSALEEARSEQEREDIREQLKRLREQQQEMLRDTDELTQQMQQPENAEQMNQTRQRLEQTRDRIRQVTEALREGQVSRAVASGTRAQRELEEMQDELRSAASNRFSEDVARLREQTQSLERREQELAEKLAETAQSRRDSNQLRPSDDSNQLRNQFEQQRQDLEQLLEQIRETVRETEEAEPLVARRLYDSVREAQQQHVGDALDTTQFLVDRGLFHEAEQVESQAARGLQRLREGVEDAAAGLLGSEKEAWEKAHEMLEDLTRQLNEELRRETGQTSPRSREETAADGEPTMDAASDQDPADQLSPLRPSQTPANEPQQSDALADRSADTATARSNSPAGQSRGTENPREGRRPLGIEDLFGPSGPMTGEFLPWYDQLRDVEEMLGDPAIRSEATRIGEAAREIRRQSRGAGEGPNWDLVRVTVAEPLNELRDRVAEELLRLSTEPSLVPIDRDPVPARFSEEVRRYYESLGSGE
jgi:hypothetical protein